ncbi:Abscisate beta-glucosyltransferase [Bertholletia excelsa]
MVVNSFYDLESAYADYYRKAIGIKAWHVGPVSLFNQDDADKAERGDKASIDKHNCLSWLDSKKPNSVLYICFGSLTRFSKNQLTEMASALEEGTSCSFIWVVPKVLKSGKKDQSDEGEWWLPEGFEERVVETGKGIVIKGWAPQVLILEHLAIGGFLTHCGWNSILEGLTAGVPLVTWPVIADQFYNEKLVTQVLKFGVAVGNEDWKVWATEETTLIGREKITTAVNKVMKEGDEADEMRRIVKKLGESAKKAVEEGGSSCNELKRLIEDIKSYGQN